MKRSHDETFFVLRQGKDEPTKKMHRSNDAPVDMSSSCDGYGMRGIADLDRSRHYTRTGHRSFMSHAERSKADKLDREMARQLREKAQYARERLFI